MSMDVRKVRLDFNKTFQQCIPSVQGDTGRSIEFQIMDGSLPEDITGETVKIFGLKPDGFRVFNNATITDARNGKCVVDLTLQMLCVAGIVQCTLVRYKNDEKLSSRKFNIEVAKSVADDIEIESTSEYLALTEALSNMGNDEATKTEVVSARKGFETLGKRLDVFDSQLEQNMNYLEVKKANKNDLDFLKTNGIGNKVLLDNGTYADFSGGQVSSVTLYNEKGLNENGAITQKGITDTLSKTLGLKSIINIDGYLNNKGEIVTDSVWKTTDFIKILCHKFLNIKLVGHDSVHSICFYDDNKKFISSIKVTTNYDILSNDNFLIPSNASYVKFSYSDTMGLNNVDFITNGENILEEAEDIISNYTKKLIITNKIIDISSFPSNEVYTTTGFKTYEAWFSTDYQEINFTEIKGTLKGYTTVYSIAYFDKNKVFISGILSSGNGLDVSINSTPPVNAKYYILSAPMGQTPTVNIELIKDNMIYTNNELNELKNKIDINNGNKITNEYLRVLFTKALCIGDSLTEGDYGSNPQGTANVKSENYPYFLSKITGWQTVNKGFCGINTTNFWLNKVKNIDFTGIDIIFILLGTNGGLTDTLSSDVVGSDYNNYANTHTGSYCKIIEYIKEQKPTAQICLINIPQVGIVSKEQLVTTNKVITQIANKYTLPLVDIYNCSKMNFDNGTIYRPIDDLHFGKLGYLTLAGEIEELFYNYIANNPQTLNIN